MKYDLKQKDERSYFYNIKTKQFKQIKNEFDETRNIVYRTVQKARKLLAEELWIDTNTVFKITKKKNIYTVETDRTTYSPFADRKFFIKGLEVEFKNIKSNPKNIYENVKIVTAEEYNELFIKKLTNLSDVINNSSKKSYEEKVEKLKKLETGGRRTQLDESFKTIFLIQRVDDNTFEIIRAYKNSNLVVSISTKEKDRFTYSKLSNCTTKVRDAHILGAINMAIEFIENG